MFPFVANRLEWLRPRTRRIGVLIAYGAFIGSLFPSVDTASAQAIRERKMRVTITLTLPEAVKMAMEHNRKLQIAGLGITEAVQKRDLVRSAYYPHIKNESSALHITALEGVVIPAGAFSTSPTTPTETKRIGQGGANGYTSGTSLAQPITQLFKVRAEERAANADLEISRLNADDVGDSIAFVVHKLYYQVLVKQSQLSAVEESIQAAVVAEQESEQAVKEGKALDVASLETRASLLEQKQASLTAQLAIDDLVMQFDDLLGIPLGTKLQLDPALLGDDPVLPSEEATTSILGDRNPKVKSAAQNVEKAKAAVTAAKDAYIPNVTGVARYSYQSGIPFLVHNFGTFGGAVSYELFDGGARQATLKQAQTQLRIAELQFAQTKSDIAIQVSAVYDDIHKLQELLKVTSETVAVRQEQTRVNLERSSQSAVLASEVARSHASIASAQASLLETKLALLLAKKQLQMILGQRPD